MKKVLLIIMTIIFLITMSACSGETSAPSNTGNTGNAENISSNGAEEDEYLEMSSYEEGYEAFKRVSQAISDKVNGIIDDNNYALEEEYPNDFYEKSDYVDFSFPMAFVNEDMAFTAAFGGETASEEIQKGLLTFFDGCEITEEDSSWRIDYSVAGSEIQKGYSGYITAVYDEWMESLKFTAFSDEDGEMKMTAFVEFVTLDYGKYAIYDMDEQAIVTYKNGEVTELVYSCNKHGYEELKDKSWYNEPGIYPEGYGLGESWVSRDRDELQCFVKYADGMMKLEIRDAKLKYDSRGKLSSVEWNWSEHSVAEK